MVAAQPSLPAEPPLRIRSHDGIKLAVQRHEPGNGAQRSPIVLAHGFGQTRQAWQHTAARLAGAGHPVLSFDARGHGESGRNRAGDRYDGAQFVADLDAVAALVEHPPVLVGASMGGLVGLLAEAGRPRFRALVLVDVTPRWQKDGVARILHFMTRHRDGFDSLAQAAAAIAGHLPQRRGPRPAGQLASLLREDADGRWYWHWDPRLLDEFANGLERHQPSMLAAARSVRLPVLLVSGGRSDLVSTEDIADFLGHVPGAEHVRLPGATHMVAGDDNDAFTAAILEFLTRHGEALPVHPIPGES